MHLFHIGFSVTDTPKSRNKLIRLQSMICIHWIWFSPPLIPLFSCHSFHLSFIISEFQMSLPTDHFRKQQLLGNMCKRRHPMSKFMWGKFFPFQFHLHYDVGANDSCGLCIFTYCDAICMVHWGQHRHFSELSFWNSHWAFLVRGMV